MRARHRHGSHVASSKGVHRSHGGGVCHPQSAIMGEGTAPKLHGAKRKRGGGIHIKKEHQGLLHKNLGVPKGQKIPAKKLSKALHSSNKAVKKRAVFAENAKHWHH